MNPPATEREVQRFLSHVVKTETCWLWTAYCDTAGYGKITFRMKAGLLAHRVAYEMFVGPIPEGMTIDHVLDSGCTNLNCVNPAHGYRSCRTCRAEASLASNRRRRAKLKG